MIGWLLDLIPWWVWVPLGVGALFAAYQFLGLRGLMAAGGAVALWFAYIFGRKSGTADAEVRREREQAKAREERHEMDREATAAEKRVREMSDEEALKEAMKWAKR
jgi:threonine/homoserine/homoserine lactone efflux protein